MWGSMGVESTSCCGHGALATFPTWQLPAVADADGCQVNVASCPAAGGDPQLWHDALDYFARQPGDCSQQVRGCATGAWLVSLRVLAEPAEMRGRSAGVLQLLFNTSQQSPPDTASLNVACRPTRPAPCAVPRNNCFIATASLRPLLHSNCRNHCFTATLATSAGPGAAGAHRGRGHPTAAGGPAGQRQDTASSCRVACCHHAAKLGAALLWTTSPTRGLPSCKQELKQLHRLL